VKAIPIPSLVLIVASCLFILSPNRDGQGASDSPKKKTEKNEEAAKPSRRVKGESRQENKALQELRESLEKSRAELERTRESLHEAHKELGSKAETISTLEAKLSSVTAQLEKAREELKKSGPAADTLAKQERQLEAGRKKVAELQAEIKALEKKATTAIAAAKDSAKAKQPSKAMASKAEVPKKTPASSKTPVIEPISYDLASAVNYPERDRALKEVAEALKKSPKAKVEIIGHADDSSYAETNEDVSNNRAKFLAAYFVINGIPEERILVKGLGNTEPLKGQANRRVEITILP